MAPDTPQIPDPGPEQLRLYVGAGAGELDYITGCWNQAKAMVTKLAGSAQVPDEILTRCYLEAGSELFHRRQAPNGIAQYATPEGAAPIRVARDPLVGVYPIIHRYLGGGFA